MKKWILPGVLATIVPIPAVAQDFAERGHFFGDYGWGFGMMMTLGPLFMLVVFAAVAAVVYLVFRSVGDGRGGGDRGGRQDARDILNERFARGEIEREEYEERRRVLGE